MKDSKAFIIALIGISLSFCLSVSAQYFPSKGEIWQQQKPAEAGLNEQALLEAVKFAEENEYSGSRDLRIAILKGFAREPYHDILGPTKKRGGQAGMIIKDGFVVAQWGDIKRVDMTFSAGYNDDINKTKAVLNKLIDEDQRILRDPEPFVAVSQLADNAVNYAVKVSILVLAATV